jgi:hypothetical protein
VGGSDTCDRPTCGMTCIYFGDLAVRIVASCVVEEVQQQHSSAMLCVCVCERWPFFQVYYFFFFIILRKINVKWREVRQTVACMVNSEGES